MPERRFRVILEPARVGWWWNIDRTVNWRWALTRFGAVWAARREARRRAAGRTIFDLVIDRPEE